MRARLHALAIGSLCLAIAACSDDPAGNQTPPTLALTLSAPSATAARGTSATYPVVVTRGGSFTGDVTLTTENLPAGLTATFAPAVIGGSANTSVLTIDVGATAAPGASSITVRARGNGVTEQTGQVQLQVPTPAITLVAGSGNASLVQGTSITVPVSVTRVNGYTGAIDLTLTGAPAGVSGTFAPASIAAGATTATLTIAATNVATVGTTNVTVNAAGTGVTAQTSTITLSVTPGEQPNYVLSATPAAVAAVAGQNAVINVGLARVGGFNGEVSLSVVGLPAGITGTFAPAAPTGNTSVLTLATTTAAAPGNYLLTIRGNSASLPEKSVQVALSVAEAPGIRLTLTPATLSITQSQSRQASIGIVRSGGFTGDVSLALENAPAGITGTFAPSPASGTATTLTVNVAPSTAVGAYTLQVRGSGAGGLTFVTPLSVNVLAASFTLTATPALLNITQGRTGTSVIGIVRDVNFDGNVTFTVSGVPSGAVATVTPDQTVGNTATLSVSVNGGALLGTYPMTVIGRATNRPDQVLPISVVIRAPEPGEGDIAWKFCDPARVPLVFAYRDGATGNWQGSAQTGSGTYTAVIRENVGGVAYVYNEGVLTRTDVFYGTAAELQTLAALECTQRPGATKRYTVLATGATGLDQIAIAIGSASGLANASQPIVDVLGIQAGPQDVFATRLETILGPTISRAPNRMLLRRGVDLIDGSTLPTLDFAGAESFGPASSTLTLANTLGQNIVLTGLFVPEGSRALITTYTEAGSSSTARQYFGLPTPMLLGGDLQGVLATAVGSGLGAGTARSVQTFFTSLQDRTLTFGADLSDPTYSSVNTGGLSQPRAVGPIQADYANYFTGTFVQNNIALTMIATRGYFGSATQYSLEAPNLITIPGYISDYSLGQNSATISTITATGTASGTFGLPSNGLTLRSASKSGTRTF